MKIYNYDFLTKEYIGESEASLDPQETKIQGKEVYLIPANATENMPPKSKTNEVVIYNNGWQIMADFRGEYIVNEDLEPKIVEEIGNLPEGYIVITENQAQKILEDNLYYIIQDGQLVKNPNYDEQKQAREEERVNNLTMTALDFIGVLQGFGLTLIQINTYLENNLPVKMQLTYCQNVYCGVAKALMPIEYEGITITAEMVEQAFKNKHGEN